MATSTERIQFSVGQAEIHIFKYEYNIKSGVVTIKVDDMLLYHSPMFLNLKDIYKNTINIPRIINKIVRSHKFYTIQIGIKEIHKIEVHVKPPFIGGILIHRWRYSIFIDNDISFVQGKLLNKSKGTSNVNKHGIYDNPNAKMIYF
jgi:hypothetical protein